MFLHVGEIITILNTVKKEIFIEMENSQLKSQRLGMVTWPRVPAPLEGSLELVNSTLRAHHNQ